MIKVIVKEWSGFIFLYKYMYLLTVYLNNTDTVKNFIEKNDFSQHEECKSIFQFLIQTKYNNSS